MAVTPVRPPTVPRTVWRHAPATGWRGDLRARARHRRRPRPAPRADPGRGAPPPRRPRRPRGRSRSASRRTSGRRPRPPGARPTCSPRPATAPCPATTTTWPPRRCASSPTGPGTDAVRRVRPRAGGRARGALRRRARRRRRRPRGPRRRARRRRSPPTATPPRPGRSARAHRLTGMQLCQGHCPVQHVAARVPPAVRGRDRGVLPAARRARPAPGHARPRRARLHHVHPDPCRPGEVHDSTAHLDGRAAR